MSLIASSINNADLTQSLEISPFKKFDHLQKKRSKIKSITESILFHSFTAFASTIYIHVSTGPWYANKSSRKQ